MGDKRKLIQIGFAALLARKQSVQKQYIYEDRTEDGFSFEPILRGNEPELADEEYMRKKYYSQVVYEGTMDGSIDTTIRESNPNKRAARRLWAGRKGTGWNGTGKGGYMESLQPGVPETKGTGLGTARKESDLLMQVYLEKQAEKMHVLKGKSQQATQDLFKRIADHSNKMTGVPDLSSKSYVPSYKDAGVSFSKFQTYIKPYLEGSPPPRNAPRSEQKAWVEKAVRKFEAQRTGVGMSGKYTDTHMYSTMGGVQGLYAKKLAELRPGHFTGIERERLLASNLTYKDDDGRPLFEDFETVEGFIDSDAPEEYYGRPEGPRSGRDNQKINRLGKETFSGDGGAFKRDHMTQTEGKLLRTIFKKETIDELYPKSFQKFKLEKRMSANIKEMQAGRLLNQDGLPHSVEIKDEHEAAEFVRWMVKTINDEQKKLNEIVPERAIPTRYLKTKIEDMDAPSLKGSYETNFKFSNTLRYLGGQEGLGRGGINDYKQEIVEGMTEDYKLLNGEYVMFNQFGMIKDDAGKDQWLFKNQARERRGVDMYFPQQGGLLKIHISARVIPESRGDKNRSYVTLDIPKNGITFLPDLEMSLVEAEVEAAKAEEGLNAFREATRDFWANGAMSTHMGFTMLTQGGEASRMFLGDKNPANSVAFFTNTVAPGDFATSLKSLVDIGAKEWWSDNTGFNSFFDLHEMEGGAFKEWAMKWDEESRAIENNINKNIENKWKMWVSQYAGGGATAPPPRIAKSWAAPVKLGPFVHSTKYFGQAQSVGRRKHGYYIQQGMNSPASSDMYGG
jgi:hypothetical protein